jgi:hypothetical protein
VSDTLSPEPGADFDAVERLESMRSKVLAGMAEADDAYTEALRHGDESAKQAAAAHAQRVRDLLGHLQTLLRDERAEREQLALAEHRTSTADQARKMAAATWVLAASTVVLAFATLGLIVATLASR